MKFQLDPAQKASQACSHQKFARPVEVDPEHAVCAECEAQGDTWVSLQVCLVCGYVGCCENSDNRHATHHFDDEGHPLFLSLEPGDARAWCFVDQTYL